MKWASHFHDGKIMKISDGSLLQPFKFIPLHLLHYVMRCCYRRHAGWRLCTWGAHSWASASHFPFALMVTITVCDTVHPNDKGKASFLDRSCVCPSSQTHLAGGGGRSDSSYLYYYSAIFLSLTSPVLEAGVTLVHLFCPHNYTTEIWPIYYLDSTDSGHLLKQLQFLFH